MIPTFHDYPLEPKITKCGDLLYNINLLEEQNWKCYNAWKYENLISKAASQMQATPNAVPHGHSKQCTATMPKQAQTPPKQWMLTKIMSTQSMTVQTLPCKEFQYPLLKTNGQKRSPDAMIRFKRLPMVCKGLIRGTLNMWRFMRGRSGYYTLGKIGWTFALGKLDV